MKLPDRTHDINANLLRWWAHESAHPTAAALAVSDRPAGFISLSMPAPSAPSKPSVECIRIEVRGGSTIVAATGPVGAA